MSKLDGIYRAMRRGESLHMARRVVEIAVAQGPRTPERGKAKLIKTRSDVLHGWSRVCGMLSEQGESELAGRTREFVRSFLPAQTERELIAQQLRWQLIEQRGQPTVRRGAR